jgi:hypothetical protein
LTVKDAIPFAPVPLYVPKTVWLDPFTSATFVVQEAGFMPLAWMQLPSGEMLNVVAAVTSATGLVNASTPRAV